MIEKKEEEQRKKMELLTRGAEWIQAHWRGLLARREGEKARKKGKKKGKKGKKKKKKGLKLPGFKYIKDKSEYECLVELIQHGIVKKLPPTSLKDFIGEFNYIHSMLDDIKDTPYDPSMALIRQLVTEYIIFPLGSLLVR